MSTPLHFSATVVDGLGTEATTVAYLLVPTTATIGALVTALGTWLADVDAVTDGAIKGTSMKIVPDLPGGLKAATGATWAASRVEQTAVLNLSNSATTRKYGQVIPAFSNSLISAGKVNLTAAAVAALIALLTGAVAGGSYTNPSTQALVALIDAILSFRKRRKQLSRTSFEV